MLKRNFELKDEDATLKFGASLAEAVAAVGGSWIYLYGNLGMGKTTLVRGFCQGLGYSGKVKSPTYTLVESYIVADLKLYHFDLYRLQDPEEVLTLGLDDYFQPETICLVEWPDQGMPHLPVADINCYVEVKGEGRSLTLVANTARGGLIINQL